MRELRLRTSLTLLLITVTMLTFSIIGVTVLVYRLPQTEAASRAEQQERADASSRLLDHFTASVETQLKTLSRLAERRSPGQLQPYLDAMVADGEVFEAAFVVSADGRVGALALPGRPRQALAELRGADFSNNALFKAARAEAQRANGPAAVWSDKYLSALSGKTTVGLAIPAGNAIMIGEVSLDRILLMLSTISQRGGSEVVVIDGLGQWLASSNRQAPGRHFNYATQPVFRAIVSGQALPEYEYFMGQRLLAGGALSQKLGWVIVSAAPAGMGNFSYRMTVILVIGSLFGSLLLSLAIAPPWAARIARPLKEMIERTHTAMLGDYSSPWPRRGTIVELNQLSQDLGRMVAVIQEREADLRIAAITFESPEGIVITDANEAILRVNRAFCEVTGYAPEDVVGRTPAMFKSGRHNESLYREMWDCIHRTGAWQGEVWNRHKNGEVHPKWLTILAVKNEEGVVTNYVGMQFDISERKKAEDKIEELAFFDQLTGLPNRTLLLDRLKQTMAASSRNGANGALLLIDLDNFKILNDTLGHDVGDLLLKSVARRLGMCLREGDTVARLGGDEFVVVLAGLSNEDVDAANSVEVIVEKILAALNQTHQLGDIAHHSAASIVVTLFKGDLASTDDLMKQADLAMYRSKESGRNAWRFFDPIMESVVKERAALEEELRRGLEGQQLLLHYQAQVVGIGRVTGAEALVRWRHPQRGMVSPGEFIPLAEATGLILPLGNWVLESACLQLAAWATQARHGHLTIAVNVSAHQFRHPGFVEQVRAVLRSTGANPERLKLELTESLLVTDVENVIEKMLALKAEGVGFSLDDFGTGYSSLSYLKRLPLDQLKIDQSFVNDVLTDPNDAAIARTIVALANSLGLSVIAEGVETEAQRAFLVESGCHACQGYLFSRPLPIDGFEEFASRRGSSKARQQ